MTARIAGRTILLAQGTELWLSRGLAHAYYGCPTLSPLFCPVS